MNDPVIRFKLACSNLCLSLYPDSRQYVYVQFEFIPDSGEIKLLSNQELTSEYILDMVELSATAGNWIVKNCIDIKDEDGKHLYFKFREEGDPPPVTPPTKIAPALSWGLISFITGLFVLAMWLPLSIFSAFFICCCIMEIFEAAIYAYVTRKRN